VRADADNVLNLKNLDSLQLAAGASMTNESICWRYSSGGWNFMDHSENHQDALEKKGFREPQDASKAAGDQPELARVTINKGHIPKDTLSP